MRVLIAEDNECLRDLLCVVLHAYEVVVAADGEEAVELAQCHQPDVILMDVMMPRLDGFGALERLKANEATAGIPVVLMSAGCIRPADIERGLALGAAEYLVKPFSVLDLGKRLEGHVCRQAGHVAKKRA